MKLNLAILAALVCLSACGKKPDAPAALAPEQAEHVVPSVPQTTSVSAPEQAEHLPVIAGEEVSINEPMPPVDEEGAPPKITAQGKCQGADAAHSVSGEVTIYDAGFGSRLLRIENLKSQGAGELGLAHSAAPAAADVTAMASLGALKGASGNMNYLVERKLDLAPPRALVLVARDTHALIGYCTLAAPK